MEALIIIAGFGVVIVMQGIMLRKMGTTTECPFATQSDSVVPELRKIRADLQESRDAIRNVVQRPQPEPEPPKVPILKGIDDFLVAMKTDVDLLLERHETD